MKLSIIFPVCSIPDALDELGRPHPFLLEALDSIRRGGHDDFEILVGIDGARPWVAAYIEYWKSSRGMSSQQLRVFQMRFTGSYGNAQRNALIRQARGDYLLFMDHDDCYVQGALRVVSDRMKNMNRPAFFKMRVFMFGNQGKPMPNPVTLWGGKEISQGQVGGHMFVVPNSEKFLAQWPGSLYEADYAFISKTCEAFRNEGIEPIWFDDVICLIRPWARYFRG